MKKPALTHIIVTIMGAFAGLAGGMSVPSKPCPVCPVCEVAPVLDVKVEAPVLAPVVVEPAPVI